MPGTAFEEREAPEEGREAVEACVSLFSNSGRLCSAGEKRTGLFRGTVHWHFERAFSIRRFQVGEGAFQICLEVAACARHPMEKKHRQSVSLARRFKVVGKRRTMWRFGLKPRDGPFGTRTEPQYPVLDPKASAQRGEDASRFRPHSRSESDSGHR